MTTKKTQETVNKVTDNKLILISTQGNVRFLIDKETMVTYVEMGGEIFEADKEGLAKIKGELAKIKKMSIEIKKSEPVNTGRNMGDTVFLYGPTGTGKTHSVLDWVNKNKIEHTVITVSDGFEDIDFLTYILTTDKGIQYKEKEVVQLFRHAAAGNKVAILIDEVNRASKSFMNTLLTLTDKVTGTFNLNNFVKDEVIRVPIENIIWFCTANLGGSYSGTNEIDEALLDRFNKVEFVNYSDPFEASLLENFGEHKDKVKEILVFIRSLFTDNSIKRPISSRGLKMRAEDFINTAKTKEDVFGSFERTLLYRLVNVDSYGFTTKSEEGIILSKFMKSGFISSVK